MLVLTQICQPLEQGLAVAKKKFKPEDIKIVWFGLEKPSDDIIDDAENLIRQELYDLMDNGNMKLSDLMFYTVFLTKDMDGPCVSVAPLAEKNTVECVYSEKTEWVSIGSNNDDEELLIAKMDNREGSTKH